MRSVRDALERMRRRWQDLSPPAVLVLSFVFLSVEGTLGLLLIPGLVAGERLTVVDALFTMTSAVCVTGLVVVDTATAFTRLGQLWILLHFQLGGIGLITLTTMVIGSMGRALSLRSEMLVGAPRDVTHRLEVKGILATVARLTFAIEAVGAILLFPPFARRFGLVEGAWHAFFHAVSAFCNAGFSTFSTSLLTFAEDSIILLTVAGLAVLGSFGYLSLDEIGRAIRRRREGGVRRLSVHTWAALVTTAALLGGGTVLFAVFEWDGVLRHLGVVDRLVNAVFMAVTRTAGFNTVPYGELTNSAVSVTILLMFVGGSPGSTAGGMKTTTAAVLVALAVSRVRGRHHVEIHKRTVPAETVERTVSLTLVMFAGATFAVFVLGHLETHPHAIDHARAAFLPIIFEVVSAFATVGLSMGVTPELSDPGKLFLVLLMLAGRVGPLAFFAAMSFRGRAQPRTMRAAHEDLVVG